jgi:phage tail tape-measure protein
MKLNFRKQFEEDMVEAFKYMKEVSDDENARKVKDVAQWITNIMRDNVYKILSIKRTNGVDEEDIE